MKFAIALGFVASILLGQPAAAAPVAAPPDLTYGNLAFLARYLIDTEDLIREGDAQGFTDSIKDPTRKPLIDAMLAPRLGEFAQGLDPVASPVPMKSINRRDCFNGAGHPEITCKDLTLELLTSLQDETTTQVEKAMGTAGEAVDGKLHFFSNHQTEDGDLEGNVYFIFGAGKVISIYEMQDSTMTTEYLWNLYILPDGCSDSSDATFANLPSCGL
ncbi:MAG: hypothetical protein P4M09_16875 [Devosia sp.]|nr:hypothetical protein [Devosia sp.]